MESYKKFLAIFFPALSLCAVVLGLILYHEVEQERNRVRASELRYVNLAGDLVQQMLGRVQSDLLYLSQQHLLSRLVNSYEPARDELEDEYATFVEQRQVYDQVRYIDAAGHERVRVDYRGGKAVIVPWAELQDKSNRYYFQSTMEVSRGQMYVSPLDLNVEHGEIELPGKPMIRFGLPLFSWNNEPRGILILNYLGQELLDVFEWLKLEEERELWLLNAQGYWLAGRGDFAFMFEAQKDFNLQLKLPDLWRALVRDASPQFEVSGTLYTHKHICGIEVCSEPLDKSFHGGVSLPYHASDLPWTIVSVVPENYLSVGSIVYRNGRALLPAVLILLAIVVFMALLARRIVRSIEALRVQDRQISQMQKMDALGHMAGGIAHDFNNILSIAIGHVGRLRTSVGENSSIQERLRKLQGVLDRATSLTRKLLDFSRYDQEGIRVVDVGSVVGAMRELLGNSLTPSIDLEFKIDSRPMSARIDPSELENAVINLAVNARDAMDGAGGISIGVRRVHARSAAGRVLGDLEDREYVEVSVKDGGCGIAENDLEKVFEPFYTTKGVGVGTGLGLPGVVRFARGAGGAVGIRSEIGVGTSVSIYLPLSSDSTAVAARPRKAQDTENDRPRGLRGARLLLVEDEQEIREMTSELLIDEGLEVVETDSAEKAIELIGKGAAFDILFADVNLGGDMDGIDLVIQALEKQAGIRVLLTSGNPLGVRERLKQSGRQFQVLAKPYGDVELMVALRHVLEQSRVH